MPNWCSNYLRIRGFNGDDEIQKFKKKAKSKDGDFQLKKFLPIPIALKYTQAPSQATKKEQNELKKKFGATDWYRWCVNNWGTKWDMSDCELIDENEYEIKYSFNSPWSPPIEGLAKISKMYPDLTFILDYEEEGMGFKGITKFKNGTVEDHCIDT